MGIIGLTNYIREKQAIDFFAFAKSLPNTEYVGDSQTAGSLKFWSVFIKEQ